MRFSNLRRKKAGGLEEICFLANDKPVQGKKIDWIKWLIWIPWIGLILWMVIQAGGYQRVDLFLDTENGISVAGSADRPAIYAYVIYYGVIALFVGLALLIGRRAACHSVCWMAPFMIAGRKIRNLFGWSSLRLVAQSDKCSACFSCERACPMSLPVNKMVAANHMENSECILCGSCIDNCSQKVIRYSFTSGKK